MSCAMCEAVAAGRDIVASNGLAVAFLDAYPSSEGHVLVVPRRCVADWFELDDAEMLAVMSLAKISRAVRADGWNIGVNVGEAAGQTVMHAHLHVIPRREGDCDDPRGGLRWVLPDTAAYWTSDSHDRPLPR